MKNTLTIILSLFTMSFFAQVIQKNAPWIAETALKNKQNITLEEAKTAAFNYFSSIDKNKKGSGLKPFERWNYHWNFYTKPDGTIAPARDLWEAWEKKNQMNNNQARTDVSNWTALGPYSHTNTASWSPGQGRINAIAVDPNNSNTLYVGAPAGGIWKSTDGGIKWQPLTDYLPQIGVSGIVVHPTDSQTIYIATGDDDASDSYAVGVWKTTDGGETWNVTGNLEGNPNSMNDIYIHPTNHNTVMVATSTGVHKSTNGGTSWTRTLSANIRDLKMKPSDPTVWYAATSSVFYKSTDSGETFTSRTIPGLAFSTRLVMDVTPANSNYIYIISAGSGNAFNGVYKSTNSGETFAKTAENDDIFNGSTQAWYDLALTVSDTDENKVYIGVVDIWSSNDGGNDFSRLTVWSAPNSANYTHADIHIMRFIDGKFYVGSDGGIYISSNHGINFTDLTENLAISQFYKISVAQQNAGNIVGGLQDNGGYALSDNNWNNYFGADGMDAAISKTDSNTYYGFLQYGGALFTSIDAGLTRNGNSFGNGATNAPADEVNTNTGDSGGKWVTPLVSDNSGNIYAGYSQLYRLENEAWTKVSNHNFFGDLDHIEIDPNDDNNIYVSRSGTLYRSTDAGVTFSTVATFFETINSIEINSNDSNIAYLTTNSDVKKSTNVLGTSPIFTNITANLPPESKLVVRHHARSGKNTIYVGSALGVYFVNDDSPNWEIFDNNLPNVAVRDLEINEEESILFAATYGRGIFKTTIPKILPSKDVKLTAINNPSNISCSSTFSPEIVVKNNGINTITTLDINYTLDGVLNTTNWTGNINSEEFTNIDLPSLTLAFGNHSLKIEITTTDDAYDTNNTKEVNFIVNNTLDNPTIVNTFEDANDELLTGSDDAGNTNWAMGKPTGLLLNTAVSGNNVYGTNLRGNYTDSAIQYLYTSCIDLASISTPVLSFKMAFDIEEDWDYLVVEYSTNSGENWTILGNASDANWYNNSNITDSTGGSNLPGKQWTGEGEDASSLGGTNATMHTYSYDLAAFTNESNIVFRFKMFSDEAVNEEGVIIDDIVINGAVLSLNNEVLQDSFSVYPNPSSETFNLTWMENGKASIIVYDYTGKLILKKNNIIENSYELNLNGFSKGLYIAKISINGKQATKKLILE